MFSGIVEAQSKILTLTPKGECVLVRVDLPRGWKLVIGQSVALDGVCTTVIRVGAQFFEVELMPETLSKTIGVTYRKGDVVNLERSLRLGDRIDGHLMQGHIDTTALVQRVKENGRSWDIDFSLPKSVAMYIAPRGSVAINGVSLTVARRAKTSFSVSLIPHTIAATNLSILKRGARVNLEADMLARYVVTAKGVSGILRTRS